MEALFSGLAAIVEGVLHLALMFFQALFRLGMASCARLPKTERRRHLVAGLLGLAFVVAVIATFGGFVWYQQYDAHRRAERRAAVSQMVAARADELHVQIDEAGRYQRVADVLPEQDPWGHPLHVEYSDEEWGEALIVRSMGKDGVAATDDDIAAQRQNIRAGDVAKAVGAAIGKAVNERWNRWHP